MAVGAAVQRNCWNELAGITTMDKQGDANSNLVAQTNTTMLDEGFLKNANISKVFFVRNHFKEVIADLLATWEQLNKL